METPETLRDTFISLVRLSAEDGDVDPLPVVCTTGGKTNVEAVFGVGSQTGTDLMLSRVRRAMSAPDVTQIAFGIDRSTRPNQGTTKGNVFTYAVLTRGRVPVYGIIEYDAGEVAEPREGPEVGFWFRMMSFEVPTRLHGLAEFCGVELPPAPGSLAEVLGEVES